MLCLVNGRKPSKLVRGWSLLGRGLGDVPRLGDIGERVALTPSLILAGRRAILASCSRIPLALVLFDDSALDFGSTWSPGPWSCDDESSIRILRTLMASFPKEKNEKKYCYMLALGTGTVTEWAYLIDSVCLVVVDDADLARIGKIQHVGLLDVDNILDG